ncbi:MAG: DUF5687 family protein [Flavobacteriales bacterium]|nr:DUF5687 family protein [Flavobacteriales bacterium]
MKSFFLKHAWLGFRRSPALTQNLLQTVLLAFFAFYFAVSFLILGLVSGEILESLFEGRNTLHIAGAFLLYYLPIDILTRYFLQKFPTLSIKPYLLLPVKRSRMARYLLLRSLASFFNFLPLFLIVPFYLVYLTENYGGADQISFLLLAIGIILSSNYISFWVTKGSDLKNYYAGSMIGAILIFIYLEYEGIISTLPAVESTAEFLLSGPLTASVFIALALGVYTALNGYFKKQLHINLQESQGGGFGSNLKLGWFGRFGRPGKIMDLELRLILRAKRARAYLLSSVIVLFFPLFMIDESSTEVIYIFAGLLITGVIALNHGQLLLSWNALHFDLLMSRGNTIRDIFRAKYYFLALTCVLMFVLSLPYFFYEPRIVLYSAALLLFNASFSILIYMLLASFNSLRIDPNEGGAFSLSGFGAAHYLIGIPIFIVPIVLFYAGKLIGGEMTGLLFIAGFGILGIVFHQQLIDGCTRFFEKNRYKISAAFRKE